MLPAGKGGKNKNEILILVMVSDKFGGVTNTTIPVISKQLDDTSL